MKKKAKRRQPGQIQSAAVRNVSTQNLSQTDQTIYTNNICNLLRKYSPRSTVNNTQATDSDQNTDEISRLVKRGKALGLTREEIRQYMNPLRISDIRAVRGIHSKYFTFIRAIWRHLLECLKRPSKVFSFKSSWVSIVILVVVVVLCYKDGQFRNPWALMCEKECLVKKINLGLLDELTRPIFQCEVCRNLTTVPVVKNITRDEFMRRFGYSAIPVLVKEAASHWGATRIFSFNYFKDLYLNNTDALRVVEEQCQFFPYNTEFKSLSEALRMPPERATFREGERPWYMGWSNCDVGVGTELRRHYQRPYFLPQEGENQNVDWIFMGGPGAGAGIHIDSVDLPSWQAQISGTKTWTLIPSPECSRICHELKITVHTGDIVVVDTNAWYHSTYVHPGDISITIGSEYD